MKPYMKVVRQLNLKKKEKIGDHGVIPKNSILFGFLYPSTLHLEMLRFMKR